jgi:hypothetical protein
MARWLVSRNDGSQEPAEGLAGLKALAQAGRLSPSDMVQPPGTNEWMYASEIEELADDLRAASAASAGLDDLGDYGGGGNSAVTAVLSLVFLAVIAGSGYFAWESFNKIPKADQPGLLEQLSFSEMVVTGEGVAMRAEPKADAPVIGSAPKDSVLELLAKRGNFYKARPKKGGAEGWVGIGDVLPMYMLGGGKVVAELDPLYNPDRYLEVQNASWMQLPEQRAEQITVFQFMLRNNSRYDMTDLVMVANVKDSKGHDLEKVEFRVEGVVPAESSTMVGTLVDEDVKNDDGEPLRRLTTEATFKAEAVDDPELALKYNEGAEVKMTTEDFTEATIDIVELRAQPKEQ